MIDFKEITYEKFKMQLLKFIFEHAYWPFEDVSKDLSKIPEFAKCNSEELPKLFEFIEKFISEFGDDINSKTNRYGTIFGGLGVLARAGIKSMVESKTCNDNTVFPSNVLIIALKLKDKFRLPLCSQQDLQLIARHTEINESEYIENSDILSQYFELLNKKNNLKTDTVELFHEISGVKTEANITKSMRIQNNKNMFSLYGKAYNLKDIESSPTSFDWNRLMRNNSGGYSASDSFKKMAAKIPVSDAFALCKQSRSYNKEYNYIFPQLKNRLISELSASQITNDCAITPPMGGLLETEFNNRTYSYKLIHMLNMLLDCETYDSEYVGKLILLLIHCIKTSPLTRDSIYINNGEISWTYSRGSVEFNNNVAEKYLKDLYHLLESNNTITKYSPEKIMFGLKGVMVTYDCKQSNRSYVDIWINGSYLVLWIVASLKLNLEK